MKIFYSSCCGSSVDDPLAIEFGICPDCLENCEFEEDDSDYCPECDGKGCKNCGDE